MLRCKNSCIENIYSLTGELSGRINRLEIKVSKALKETYGCDGSSSRQNNERHTAGMCGSTILHVFRAMTRTSCTHQDPEYPLLRKECYIQTDSGNILSG